MPFICRYSCLQTSHDSSKKSACMSQFMLEHGIFDYYRLAVLGFYSHKLEYDARNIKSFALDNLFCHLEPVGPCPVLPYLVLAPHLLWNDLDYCHLVDDWHVGVKGF